MLISDSDCEELSVSGFRVHIAYKIKKHGGAVWVAEELNVVQNRP